MKKIWVKGLAHACIVLVLVMLTLLVFDKLNPSMDFINNPLSKIFMVLLCLLSLAISLLLLVTFYRKR